MKTAKELFTQLLTIDEVIRGLKVFNAHLMLKEPYPLYILKDVKAMALKEGYTYKSQTGKELTFYLSNCSVSIVVISPLDIIAHEVITAMDTVTKNKSTKKRASKYDSKLKIIGSLDDVLRVSIPNEKKAK